MAVGKVKAILPVENLQINIRKHKNLFGIVGLAFIVCLEGCCVCAVEK